MFIKSFFNILKFVLLLFPCLSSLFQQVFFFFLLDLYTGLSDCFPIVISSILLLSSFFIQRNTFSISFRMGLLLLYSFSFCLLEKFLIFPSILNDILAGQYVPRQQIFPFQNWKYISPFRTGNISCHCLLASNFSVEKSVLLINTVFLLLPLKSSLYL